MWPRVVEIMFGCWLAMSPFIFQHPSNRPWWWIVDFGSAVVIWVLSSLSFWHPARHAHGLVIVLGALLVGFGWLQADYPYAELRAPSYPPALQNDILLGLLLMMLGVVPSEANRPPQAWRAGGG